MITSQILHETLKENFGFEISESIKSRYGAILSGKDALAIMPGRRKIDLFSIPALLLSGITIVIIDCSNERSGGQKANGIQACFINSSQTETERQYIDSIKTIK
jgi:ATP-dependent DNA helicase RecQ